MSKGTGAGKGVRKGCLRCFAKLSCHCKTLNAEATVETTLRENTRENSDSCGARMTGQDFKVYSKIIARPGVTERLWSLLLDIHFVSQKLCFSVCL